MEIYDNTDNCTSNNTQTFSTAAVIISISSCSLSIFGSIVIFGTYVYISDIRNSTRKLVTCLTAADFLTALGYLISALAHFAGTQNKVCTTQSVITTYSSLVSFYLTVAIAIHIFSTVVFRCDFTSTWKFLLLANAISWIIPGIIVGIALDKDVLGSDTKEVVGTGPWCWLKRNHTNYIFWMFVTGKGWEFLCYILTTSLYVLLKLYIYLRHRFTRFSAFHHSLRENDQNYLYVWFVLYVLRLWGSIRSIFTLIGVDNNSPFEQISNVFMYMQAAGDPGQAFCNCILVCLLDNTVRRQLFVKCLGETIQENEDVAHEGIEGSLGNGHYQRCSEEAQATLEKSVPNPYLHDERERLLGSGKHQGYTEEVQATLRRDSKDDASKNVSVQSDTPEKYATH